MTAAKPSASRSSLARSGDLVIACGKGHEQSMCFGATEYLWDDRTAMRAALSEYLGIPVPANALPAHAGSRPGSLSADWLPASPQDFLDARQGQAIPNEKSRGFPALLR